MEKRVAGGGADLIHLLPEILLQDILSKLDAESLCSTAPVCRSLRSFASQALTSIPVLNLSEFSPTDRILNRVVRDNSIVTSLTLDCRRLDDSSVEVFSKGQLQELVLLKCRFSSYIFRAIGEKCPNLRLLTVEMVCPDVDESVYAFEKSLTQMLKRCLSLEVKLLKLFVIEFLHVGIFLLAERCEGLEYVRLGGFSKVSDAGYISILRSCKKLRRYEIVNAFFLSDLAFHDLSDAPNSLVEERLVSCDLLTSQSVVSLSSCRGLEVLDLSGCKSIADAALYSIPKLSRLTMLDLGGANITDSGLSALGGASSPIASLCLRGCKRITDRGIDMLLCGSGTINKTLLTLDLGCLPGVSDRAIAAVSGACRKLSSLCVRFCFFVTDHSMETLSSMEVSGSRSLRRLDIYHCSGLSVESLRFLDLPLFSGLRWLGVGRTRLASQGKE